MTETSNVLIIGSGAAGLGLALSLADDTKVTLISKDDLLAGSSQYAQGGIAAVLDQTSEQIEAHIKDTIIAGNGLCEEAVVRYTVTQAKSAIEWLLDHGVQFTIDPSSKQFHLTQEGGHSKRRILHAADRTGSAIVKTLIEQVFAHPNIRCFSQHTALDLIIDEGQCVGAYVLDNNTGNIEIFHAKETVLACGGASSVYYHTTNPDFTSGDGIAMAHRAGAQVKNLEFNQFHPTSLYYTGKQPFLISEVLRGEGGKLTLANGERFMNKYDPRAELAPRDVVTRAIHNELRQHQLDCVYLDVTHLPGTMIQSYFPTIYHYCYQQGIDITKRPIPVVPAAHYTCGGVTTNLKAQTNIPHLYAIGEVACTGLHGANRMASNSLLECLVFAASASKAIQQSLKQDHYRQTRTTAINNSKPLSRWDIRAHITHLQKLMWNKVGIIRDDDGLQLAQQQVKNIADEIRIEFNATQINRELIEYRNLIETATLMVEHAINRKTNCGLHYNTNHDKNPLTVH